MYNTVRLRLGGLLSTVIRFPVTAGFLLTAAVMTAISIGGAAGLSRYILTCAVGAAAGTAAQSCHERFFSEAKWRVALYAASVVIAALFLLTIRRASDHSPEIPLRSAVTVFMLWIAFIWFAVSRSRYSFGENFTAAFKAMFQAAFFTGILFLGCIAVIAALDRLITPVSEKAYMYAANVIFVLLAPIVFLSLMPRYPGRKRPIPEGEAGDAWRSQIEKRTGCPKFLEVLLSYIIIPLVTVFTIVLLIYIVLNVGGRFWTDNLLEPLLISYTAVVIAVTLLTGSLENRFAALFRLIFPKVLIPIALFQTIASILLLSETSLTYTRYYVILYGFFAAISGALLSTVPMRRSGAVAAVFIALSVLSIVPPTDAFNISRFSQVRQMEYVLKENDMLSGREIKPNGTIPDADKAKITGAVRYLTETDELGRVKWLPAGFNGYDDTQFYSVFGFHMYQEAQPQYTYISVYYNISGLVPISGYEAFAQVTIPTPDKSAEQNTQPLVIGGVSYTLSVDGSPGAYGITIKDTSGGIHLRFDSRQIFERYASYPASKNTLTQEEAIFTEVGDKVRVEIVVMNAGFSMAPGRTDQNAQLLVFLGGEHPE